MPLAETEEAFLKRRAEEERRRSEESPCVVGAVHEDLSESYEERLAATQAEAKALDDLARSIP